MSTLDEIEAAIRNLAPSDFARLRDWMLERDYSIWDMQIEEDSTLGRLDHLVKEIENDIIADRVGPKIGG